MTCDKCFREIVVGDTIVTGTVSTEVMTEEDFLEPVPGKSEMKVVLCEECAKTVQIKVDLMSK